MKRFAFCLALFGMFVPFSPGAGLRADDAAVISADTETPAASRNVEWAVGGCGGAYFLLRPAN